MIAAIDIGNSRTKIKIGGKLLCLRYVEADWRRRAAQFLQEADYAAISEVNAWAAEETLQLLPGGAKPLYARELIASQKTIDFSRIKGMGADRALGLLGAVAEFEPPLITIDCGTALTINALDSDRICRGGAILPGAFTQSRSLADYTSKLPLARLESTRNPIGEETLEAIKSGIMHGLVGAIENISKEIERDIFKRPAKRIITGGWSRLAIESGASGLETRPTLVCDGLLACAREFINGGKYVSGA